MRPRTEAFVGVSLDGFLARPDGTLDFLEPWQGHEHGYTALFARIDTLIFGRATWEFVATMVAQHGMAWPYGGKRCVVLTHRPISTSHGELVRAASPASVLAELAREGSKHVYVDGGVVIRDFLAAGVLDALTVSIVPVLIGEGKPLFGGVKVESGLKLEGTTGFPNGLAQLRYSRQ